MEIGLGLPTSVPGTTGREVMQWAIEGERAGFSTLAVLDRLVFDSYECLTVLAAAAAVTERARLATAVAIGPIRGNGALLAKQAASVDRLSGGRLVLGLAVGARPDDYRASATEFAGRGAAFAAQIAELRAIWAGERRGIAGAIGPAPTNPDGPPIILGGHSTQAIERAGVLADGWICGGGPAGFRAGAAAVLSAWNQAQRPGRPKLMALVYFALGDDAAETAQRYLTGYYGFAPPVAQAAVRGTPVDARSVSGTIRAYQAAGCDEIIFVPCSADAAQIAGLREAVALAGAPLVGAASVHVGLDEADPVDGDLEVPLGGRSARRHL